MGQERYKKVKKSTNHPQKRRLKGGGRPNTIWAAEEAKFIRSGKHEKGP